MSKQVFIVHRWSGNSKSDWYPWLKKELGNKGFEVYVPEMPNTDEPKINEWIVYLAKIVKTPDKNTYFIGHSIGCQTIMRYLEKIDNEIGGGIFVAGWFKLRNLENEEVVNIAKPWLETPLDFKKIRKSINKLSVILSDNEPYNFVEENSKIFKEELGAKVIIEKNKGHFTEEDGITELPIVLKEILKI